MTRREVDGQNVLYHFLQKQLYRQDVWLFQMLAARLVAALGIWFHPSLYAQFPVLLPYAVRDPKCRKSHGGKEEWGFPNKQGFFRDDNSLIKGIPRSLNIESPLKLYNGKRLGNGFVASHVWRKAGEADTGSASKDPATYSFIPNLVWLPSQVAKLTDREGSFTQLYLQALSIKIYKKHPVLAHLRKYADRAWAKLASPSGIPDEGLPSVDELSFFRNAAGFEARRRGMVRDVVEGYRNVLAGRATAHRVISRSYAARLHRVDKDEARRLQATLGAYLAALEQGHDG